MFIEGSHTTKNTASGFAHILWKGINRTRSTRWHYISWLKASAFFSLPIFFIYYETQQLIFGTGTAIWWVTEPHYTRERNALLNGSEPKCCLDQIFNFKLDSFVSKQIKCV